MVAGAGQVTPAKLGRQAALLDLERRCLLDGRVDPVHAVLELQLRDSGPDAGVDHVQEPLELLLSGVDIPAESLEALGAVEGLPLRFEVFLVVAARQVGQGDRPSLVLAVDTQEFADVHGFAPIRFGRNRIIVAALGHDAEHLMVCGTVEFMPGKQVMNRQLDEIVEVEIIDGRLDGRRQIEGHALHARVLALPRGKELGLECGGARSHRVVELVADGARAAEVVVLGKVCKTSRQSDWCEA